MPVEIYTVTLPLPPKYARHLITYRFFKEALKDLDKQIREFDPENDTVTPVHWLRKLEHFDVNYRHSDDPTIYGAGVKQAQWLEDNAPEGFVVPYTQEGIDAKLEHIAWSSVRKGLSDQDRWLLECAEHNYSDAYFEEFLDKVAFQMNTINKELSKNTIPYEPKLRVLETVSYKGTRDFPTLLLSPTLQNAVEQFAFMIERFFPDKEADFIPYNSHGQIWMFGYGNKDAMGEEGEQYFGLTTRNLFIPLWFVEKN